MPPARDVRGDVWRITPGALGPGRIEPRELEAEMRSSYLDYAMSVIVGRALPDVRDGLKPVHRRVLFGMHESGLQPNRPRVKCARVVGEVMGAYHPHGDQAIYDTLVRMAQPFSLRYLLVDGQGNFGNIDGHPAAAMRYPECRLTRLATEMLRDIDADTVDFVPNYDESRKEPSVLPSRFPNLLVNGSAGIAVGMATNIPPHNLAESIDAIVALIDDPDADVEKLSKYVKGPESRPARRSSGATASRRPTARDVGASSCARASTRRSCAAAGRRSSSASCRTASRRAGTRASSARSPISPRRASFLKISDLADYSGKDGMRIQIELKRDAVPHVVLNKLFKHTPLRTTFGYNAVALVDGVPRTLSLLELIRHYLDYQREVVTRRSKYELRKALERAHVLEGYVIALDNLDAVIALHPRSADPDEARAGLMEQFGLTEIQAQAILDLRLQRLTGLERKRIQQEYRDARSGSPSCAESSRMRRASMRSSAKSSSRSSRCTARTTTAALRSWPARTRSSWKT